MAECLHAAALHGVRALTVSKLLRARLILAATLFLKFNSMYWNSCSMHHFASLLGGLGMVAAVLVAR